MDYIEITGQPYQLKLISDIANLTIRYNSTRKLSNGSYTVRAYADAAAQTELTNRGLSVSVIVF